LVDALTDLGKTFFTDLSGLLLGFVGRRERTIELQEEEDEDDADEVGESMMKAGRRKR